MTKSYTQDFGSSSPWKRGKATIYYRIGGVSTSCAPGDRSVPTVAQGTRAGAYIYRKIYVGKRWISYSCDCRWWRGCKTCRYWRPVYEWRRYYFRVSQRIQSSYPVTTSITPFYCPPPPVATSPLFEVMSGNCFVSESGSCVSDGSRANTYPNNDECRIRAVADLKFDDDQEYIVEPSYDYVTINGKKFRESFKGPSWADSLQPGDEWTWRSDYSVTRAGWTLCATRKAPVALFEVTVGGCQVSPSGLCVSDGSGRISDGSGRAAEYGNNEACTIRATAALTFDDAQDYVIESNYDYVTVAGVDYKENGKAPSGLQLQAVDVWKWKSDGSITRDGWTLCATRDI